MAAKHVDHQEGGPALPPQETKVYNVTGYIDLVWLSLAVGPLSCCLWPYKRTLVLAPEEVTLEASSVCCHNKKRVPYGELGGVERANCCGCAAFGGGALGDSIVPGCGCESVLVDEFVGTLKERRRARGDTAQIQRAEQALDRVAALEQRLSGVDAKLDALLAHLNVPPPPKAPAGAATAAPAAQHMA